jgi:hypothetical protein
MGEDAAAASNYSAVPASRASATIDILTAFLLQPPEVFENLQAPLLAPQEVRVFRVLGRKHPDHGLVALEPPLVLDAL